VGIDNSDKARTAEVGSYGSQLAQLVVDIVDQRLDGGFGIFSLSEAGNTLQFSLHGLTLNNSLSPGCESSHFTRAADTSSHALILVLRSDLNLSIAAESTLASPELSFP
jgi:hypothetical protein